MTPRIFISTLLSSSLVLLGCASSSPEQKSEKDDTQEFIHRYEKTFNPSDYDSNPSSEKSEKKEPQKPEETTPSTPTETELVTGFRVQVSFTDNIEQANKIKDDLSSLLANQPVYVVFESPYYKVRVGDFLSRPDANITLKTLIDRGYKDAWIVPDKVMKQQ